MHGTVDELWKKFHKYIKRIMDIYALPQADFLQLKLVIWLREVQQNIAADWFQEYWTGRKGRWTSAHAGHGNVRTSSSVGGFIGVCKNVRLGSAQRNCSMNLTEFIRSVIEDVDQTEKHQASQFVDEL